MNPQFLPMLARLRAQGLIDESNNLTAAGHEHARALMAQYDRKITANGEKLRRKQEEQEQAHDDGELDQFPD